MGESAPGGPALAPIGRYLVSRRLGAGAFATVWLAHDPEFGVDVAIKVLAENWSADEAIHERFVSEARFLRRIRDRRVVHVYEIGALDDGRPYFVMDYLEAGTLEDLRRVGVPAAEALRLCAEAARGLDVLHRHHLVHRDVTPGNLLLTRRQQGTRQEGTRTEATRQEGTSSEGELAVVVADLGVARSVIDSSIGAMIVGTPSYMAPEQATGGDVDPRADVYALCAVAYALLTGSPPFRVDRVVDLTSRPDDLKPAPIAAALGAPDTLDGLFVSGLATDPQLRPPSAQVLADALDHLAAELAAAPPEGELRGGRPLPVRGESPPAAPVVPVPAPPPPTPATRLPAATRAPAATRPAGPDRVGRSSAFYITMTVLAVLIFAVFVVIVVGTSL